MGEEVFNWRLERGYLGLDISILKLVRQEVKGITMHHINSDSIRSPIHSVLSFREKRLIVNCGILSDVGQKSFIGIFLRLFSLETVHGIKTELMRNELGISRFFIFTSSHEPLLRSLWSFLRIFSETVGNKKYKRGKGRNRILLPPGYNITPSGQEVIIS